jgi:hypothetical protein
MNNLADDTVVQLRDFSRRRPSGPGADNVARWMGAARGTVESVRGTVESVDELVRSNPWRVAGLVGVVAVGAGFLASRLSGRATRTARRSALRKSP